MDGLKDIVIPFGKYKGVKLEDVPLTYLDWLMGVMKADIDKPTKVFKGISAQKKHTLLYQQVKKYLNDPLIKQEWAKEMEARDD